jgi:hypothetical protein
MCSKSHLFITNCGGGAIGAIQQRADGDGTAPPCSPRRIAAGLRGFEGPHPASGAAGGPAAGGEASDGTGAAKQKGIKGAAQQKGTRGR